MTITITSFKEFGIRTDNLRQSLLPYTLLFFLLAFAELLFLKTGYNTTQLTQLYFSIYSPLWLVIPVSILQEVVFMGYGMAILRKNTKSKFIVIGITVVLFTLAHIIFPYPAIILPGAFIAGVGFSITYYSHPNLLLISLVHTLLNFLPALYCTTGVLQC